MLNISYHSCLLFSLILFCNFVFRMKIPLVLYSIYILFRKSTPDIAIELPDSVIPCGSLSRSVDLSFAFIGLCCRFHSNAEIYVCLWILVCCSRGCALQVIQYRCVFARHTVSSCIRASYSIIVYSRNLYSIIVYSRNLYSIIVYSRNLYSIIVYLCTSYHHVVVSVFFPHKESHVFCSFSRSFISS
jgi:hypothetical protein